MQVSDPPVLFRFGRRAVEIVTEEGWVPLGRRVLWRLKRFAIDRVFDRILRGYAKYRLRRILQAYAGRTIIVFQPIVGWNMHLFQRPQNLAMELAARGYLYFYCFPANDRDPVLDFHEVAPGCFITPHHDLLDALPNKLIHVCSTDNFTTLEWLEQRMQAGDHVLYEYIDEIHEDISGREIPRRVLERHEAMLRDERIVCVATADKLFREVQAARTNHCALVTNGADIRRFSVRRDPGRIPQRMQGLVAADRPVIGYFGALASWFDYALVTRLAAERPDFQIVLIGPDYDGSAARSGLDSLPNVHMMGTVEHGELPAHACWFDVAMIPFKVNEITGSTSPIKLFEYMALGLPIVTTGLPECRKYRSVNIAESADAFIAAVDAALTLRDSAEYLALLAREANENSWAHKAQAVDRLIQGRLQGGS
jgi:teichuronic acid biosynthesis glycosyltransferase TuaH